MFGAIKCGWAKLVNNCEEVKLIQKVKMVLVRKFCFIGSDLTLTWMNSYVEAENFKA